MAIPTASFFRSCDECPQEIECQVEGSLPEWLNGSYIRLGPGKWDLPGKDEFTMNHWLDGCAMLIKFRIEDGRAFFSSKFLRSSAYTKMMANGYPVYTEFGTRAYPDSSKGLVTRLFQRMVPSDLTDNDISNLYLLNKRLFVATESCNIWKIDPANITGVEKFNLDREVKVNLSCSHPLYSPSDNCFYNIGTSFLSGMKYTVYKVPATDFSKNPTAHPFLGVDKLAVIPSRWKVGFSYIHSFAMTENFIVIIEQPLVMSALRLATCTLNGKSMQQCLEWHADECVRFYVINKSTGDEQPLDKEYDADPFFFFHVINAYEKDDQVVIDLVAYDDAKVLEKYHIPFLRRNQFGDYCQPAIRRYVIPLAGRFTKGVPMNPLVNIPDCSASAKVFKGFIKLYPEQLSAPGFELPTINSSFACHEHRYVYGSGTFDAGFFKRSAVKMDLKEQEIQLWRPSDTGFPGEAVFVAKPDSKEEDDGILLSVVLEADEAEDNFLAILEAPTMTELARIIVPKAAADIPPTIHGLFIPNIKEIIV